MSDHQGAGDTMIPLPTGVRVWIAAGHIEMCRGMQSVALQVQEALKGDSHAAISTCFAGGAGWHPLHVQHLRVRQRLGRRCLMGDSHVDVRRVDMCGDV